MKLIKEFDDLLCETSIIEDNDGCKLLECKIDNCSYSFNVDWVPGNQLNWLAQVYSNLITNAYNNGEIGLKNKLRSNIKNIQDLLGY